MGYRREESEERDSVTSPAQRADAVVDPFGASAQPARYVPRAATERALDALVETVVAGGSAVLAGIPGVGKTLLLHLLAERIAPEIRCVYLPYPSLPLGALCAWALEELGAPSTYDSAGALVAWARRERDDGRGLLLAVDDAEAMPESALRELARMAAESRGDLRIVAAVDMAKAEAVREALGEVALVALRARMSEEETCAYVHGHLETARVPAGVAAGFDARTLSALHQRAGGLPSRVNAEASALLRLGLGRLEAAERRAAASEAAAFERAAGRLALAERGAAGEPDAAFERAVGRLVLARAAAQPEAAEPAAAKELAPAAGPAPAAAEAAASPAAAAPRAPAELAPTPAATPAPTRVAAPAPTRLEVPAPARVAAPARAPVAAPVRRAAAAPRRRWRRAAVVVGLCFLLGTAAGVLVARRGPAPAPPELASGAPPEAAPPAVVSEAVATVVLPEPAPEASAVEAPAPEASAVEAPAAESAGEASPPVSVQINATPWAEIRIDGVEVGITPLSGVQLGAGEHVFEARFPDGRSESRRVAIDAENRFVAFDQGAPRSD
jgi:hypothetical protein